MNAIRLIEEERNRQITHEGYSFDHDDRHTGGEIALAAAAYAAEISKVWPWDSGTFKPSGDRIRNLVKAGALVVAEIERIQRAESSHPDWIKSAAQECTDQVLVGAGHTTFAEIIERHFQTAKK